MKHFPVFINTTDQKIVLVGGGNTAVAKLRLLLKTDAQVVVVGESPCSTIRGWAANGQLTIVGRKPVRDDFRDARLVYAATDDPKQDQQIADFGRAAGALVNVVDNLRASDFITPAIVDRDPVTVAIGTEGTAPVLARSIKSDVESLLPRNLGILARVGAGFRTIADRLPKGRVRREFWARFFTIDGPDGLRDGPKGAASALKKLFDETDSHVPRPGRVTFVGAGPGDPELLTRKAHKILHEADVVIHDRLVSAEVLELARREAVVLDVGKSGFGPSWKQGDINAEMIRHATKGHHVVRLKGGDPVVFGRLDEETQALGRAGVAFDVVPGISAANAAAASLGVSLTARGRNSGFRVLTAHDVNGFAEADWRGLAAPGSVAAIYMGKRAVGFVAGRLLMFGADANTPVTAVANASHPDMQRIETRLADLGQAFDGVVGPVVILLGISVAKAATELHIKEKVAL